MWPCTSHPITRTTRINPSTLTRGHVVAVEIDLAHLIFTGSPRVAP